METQIIQHQQCLLSSILSRCLVGPDTYARLYGIPRICVRKCKHKSRGKKNRAGFLGKVDAQKSGTNSKLGSYAGCLLKHHCLSAAWGKTEWICPYEEIHGRIQCPILALKIGPYNLLNNFRLLHQKHITSCN